MGILAESRARKINAEKAAILDENRRMAEMKAGIEAGLQEINAKRDLVNKYTDFANEGAYNMQMLADDEAIRQGFKPSMSNEAKTARAFGEGYKPDDVVLNAKSLLDEVTNYLGSFSNPFKPVGQYIGGKIYDTVQGIKDRTSNYDYLNNQSAEQAANIQAIADDERLRQAVEQQLINRQGQ